MHLILEVLFLSRILLPLSFWANGKVVIYTKVSRPGKHHLSAF